MDQLQLTLPNTPPKRRRGRPPGARNKRSVDLARYVAAMFGGMTPGQQAAELALVTPKDLRTAKAEAIALNAEAERLLGQAKAADAELSWYGFIDPTLPPLMLAMTVKASKLARALGCSRRDAWMLLEKERADLMPFVHQKQPMAEVVKPGQLPTMFVVSERDIEQATLGAPVDQDELDLLEDFRTPGGEVGPDKSDDQP